ncbi:MAG: DNA topoisomerase 4 subunit A [Cyanosarcina radialis HA8281-LM2]|jgi:DNA gyrase subunit A|nr:DNA topoisomerase 4 subunit A [Cyanosarcina radialis HA8281-LM2]
MAKQLNLLATGQVVPTALHAEMQRSYLEYAMSVIVGRALPDARDGLKPVHRRILYAMHELGLTPDRPYRKSARVVGDVLGKYHPHGDQSVYDALVRMAQDWATRYPLVDGHGNFGSVDDDPPAAMRYTETRLAGISHEVLLSEIGESTVDFSDNFDGSGAEPVVLPAQLPILLLNGCTGIAVGMATNIPPHNLAEVVDGLIALIDRPDLPDEQLWKIIPAPDFPTGGEIVETQGIREAYSTGKGIITIRGIAQVEEITRQSTRAKNRDARSRASTRTAIVVTELPYQVNKAAWIEKVAELVNSGKIEGIADVRDESDREGMRAVIELKRDTDPKRIIGQLYKETSLQNNFGAILLALVDGQPRQLSLRQLLERFLDFREQTLTRRYTHDLEQAQKRIHLVEGLLAALNHLDDVIEILRNAPDGSTAKLNFQEQLNFSESQADAILAMPMRRLTGLEKQNLQAEYDQLSDRIQLLQRLLGDRHELLKVLKKDLRTLKRKYGNPRRTKLANRQEERGREGERERGREGEREKERQAKKGEVPKSKPKTQNSKVPATIDREESLPILDEEPTEAIVELTQKGYIRRLANNGKAANSKSNGDFTTLTQLTNTQAQLVAITSGGKAYPIEVGQIPPDNGSSKGTPLITLLPASFQGTTESLVGQFFLPEDPATASLVLFTQQGQIKRLSASELANMTARGLTVIKLKENDALKYACLTQGQQEVVLATSGGRLLRFQLDDRQLPVMGRGTQGIPGLRLGRAEQLVGAATLNFTDRLLLVSALGYGKCLPVNALRLANRTDIGTSAMQFTTKTDALAAMVLVSEAKEIALITSDRQVRLAIDRVPLWGKDGAGDRLVELKPNEQIVGVAAVRSS